MSESLFASPRLACGEEGVGPFSGLYCVLNEGHPRPPGHVYAERGADQIDHLDARLLVADEAWKREAELRNEQAAKLTAYEAALREITRTQYGYVGVRDSYPDDSKEQAEAVGEYWSSLYTSVRKVAFDVLRTFVGTSRE